MTSSPDQPKPISEEELKEMEAEAAAAKPGPWEVMEEDGECWGIGAESATDVVETDSGVYPPDLKTARFIASSRANVPRLIAEVRRLRAKVVELDGIIKAEAQRIGEPCDQNTACDGVAPASICQHPHRCFKDGRWLDDGSEM